MNDRFKFRAWNKEKQKMVYNVSNLAIHLYTDEDYRPDPKWELMQCTGLRDKNGALIYEGDILHYSQQYYIVRFGTYDTHAKYSNIVKGHFCAPRFYLEGVKNRAWKNIHGDIFEDFLCENSYAFMFMREEGQYGGNFEMYLKEWGFEILGNIYQNGDLLC